MSEQERTFTDERYGDTFRVVTFFTGGIDGRPHTSVYVRFPDGEGYRVSMQGVNADTYYEAACIFMSERWRAVRIEGES